MNSNNTKLQKYQKILKMIRFINEKIEKAKEFQDMNLLLRDIDGV